MAELTIDPTEYQEGELTAEEQDSLEVGERLSQEEQNLLAGKFRDAEELENAYIELQKRFSKGEHKQAEEEEAPEEASAEEEPIEEDEPIDANLLDQLWESAAAGEIPQELAEQLKGLSQEDILGMYLEQRMEVEKQKNISPETVEELKGSVGGSEQYQQLVGWAADNLPKEQIDLYDQVMSNGDPAAMWFAIQALNFAYRESAGYEGELLTGKPAQSSADVFRSQAEVVRAMRDPRYDSDPAYRMDVAEKLERSNLQF